MTQTVVSIQKHDPKERIKYWNRYELIDRANEYKRDLHLDRQYLAKPLPWIPVSRQHSLSDWYYQLWFFYEIRLKLVTKYGQDYDYYEARAA